MNLDLDRLESRDTPAAFDQAFYAEGFEPIAGYRGPIQVFVADVNGDGTVDDGYAAGEGGGPRVVIKSGGRLNEPPVPSGTPGVNKVAGAGDVLFDGFVFSDEFRGGVSVAAINRVGDSDIVVFAPGAGGGAHLKFVDFKRGTEFSRLAFGDPNYRGGVNIETTTFHPEFPAEPAPFGLHLLATTKAGGAPRAEVFTAEGDVLASFFFGPESDRREYTIIASDVDLPGEPQHRGLYFEVDGFRGASDWFGNPHSVDQIAR